MRKKVNRFFYFILLLFLPIFIKVSYLQIIKGERYERLAFSQRIRRVIIRAPRGRIFDAQKRIIAETKPAFSFSIIPAEINLNQINNFDFWGIKEKIKGLEKYPYPILIKRNLTKEEIIRLEENLTFRQGIRIEVIPARSYPFKNAAAHTIGYLGEISQKELEEDTFYDLGDLVGRYGIEDYYEKVLRGKNGEDFIEIDARGREIQPFSEIRGIPPVTGADLYLALDITLCVLAESLLLPYPRGCVIALNPKTGGVVVLHSKPNFDPNQFVAISQQVWEKLKGHKDKPFFNRASQATYPPGSVFKPFLALKALSKNIINPNTIFKPCLGKFRIGNRDFKCWTSHGHLNLISAIAQSCNTYFYQLGILLGLNEILSTAHELKIDERTGIDVKEENPGKIPKKTHFSPLGRTANISIGQGELLVTPLRMALSYSALANNGVISKPYLVDSIKNFKPIHQQFLDSLVKKELFCKKTNSLGETVYAVNVLSETLNFSKEDFAIIKKGLYYAVVKGTGAAAYIPEIPIYGKTGTAQNPFGKPHAWFVGYAENDKASLVVSVLIENAGKGGAVAAPIAKEIFRRYFTKELAPNLLTNTHP